MNTHPMSEVDRVASERAADELKRTREYENTCRSMHQACQQQAAQTERVLAKATRQRLAAERTVAALNEKRNRETPLFRFPNF